jgi:ketosteroid isomerase-like protein
MSTAYDIRDELVLAFNDHDLRRLSQCYSPSAVLVGPEGVAEGQEQIATFWEQLLTAFLDARLTPWYKATVSDPAATE